MLEKGRGGGRPSSHVWTHFRSEGTSSYCKYCGGKVSSQANRLQKHLSKCVQYGNVNMDMSVDLKVTSTSPGALEGNFPPGNIQTDFLPPLKVPSSSILPPEVPSTSDLPPEVASSSTIPNPWPKRIHKKRASAWGCIGRPVSHVWDYFRLRELRLQGQGGQGEVRVRRVCVCKFCGAQVSPQATRLERHLKTRCPTGGMTLESGLAPPGDETQTPPSDPIDPMDLCQTQHEEVSQGVFEDPEEHVQRAEGQVDFGEKVKELERKIKFLELTLDKVRDWAKTNFQSDIPIDFFMKLSALEVDGGESGGQVEVKVERQETEEILPDENCDMNFFEHEPHLPEPEVNPQPEIDPQLIRKRGRPRKYPIPFPQRSQFNLVKRKRGRPRKDSESKPLPNPLPETSSEPNLDYFPVPPGSNEVSSEAPSTKRNSGGRPPSSIRLHFTPSAKRTKALCKYCGAPVSGVPERLKNHLLKCSQYNNAISGNNSTNSGSIEPAVFTSKLNSYNCNFQGCGKTFQFLYMLNDHLRKTGHGDKLPKPERKKYFLCSICGKTLNKTYEERHLSFHKNERQFKCEFCGAGFNIDIHLKKHRLIHTKDTATGHMCDICGKTFFRMDSLKAHKAVVHAESRPWICSVCGKSFKVKRQLTLHEQHSHLGEGQVPCELCGRKFHTGKGLVDHIARSHKEQNEIMQTMANLIKNN